MHGVHERQPISALHHTQHELPGDAAGFLVHAEGTHVIRHLTFAVDAHCGQVVEHHRDLLVEHGPQLSGHAALHRLGPIHERIHRAQQLIVGHCLGNTGHGHRLQPLQAAEFRVRCAQAIEDHGAHEGFGVELST